MERNVLNLKPLCRYYIKKSFCLCIISCLIIRTWVDINLYPAKQKRKGFQQIPPKVLALFMILLCFEWKIYKTHYFLYFTKEMRLKLTVNSQFSMRIFWKHWHCRERKSAKLMAWEQMAKENRETTCNFVILEFSQ